MYGDILFPKPVVTYQTEISLFVVLLLFLKNPDIFLLFLFFTKNEN